ncbi:hypothetical protein [Methanococcoides sp. AM1]|uniref:hypothetical protein n=1 Tax=Methanococcoides sp. AM1 TaxID=1201011 RepID=UPI00108385C9|nr:hypothetical protein [Methanococcoides sp. AM1]
MVESDVVEVVKLHNELEELQKKIAAKVPLDELLDESFMRIYTFFGFVTVQELIDACEGLIGLAYSDIDKNDEKFNEYIRDNTSFDNWSEMIGKATMLWAEKQLEQK